MCFNLNPDFFPARIREIHLFGAHSDGCDTSHHSIEPVLSEEGYRPCTDHGMLAVDYLEVFLYLTLHNNSGKYHFKFFL